MPKKTKADLERDLNEATRILKDITNCFKRGKEPPDTFNKLEMNNVTIEKLDFALDEAREFLK